MTHVCTVEPFILSIYHPNFSGLEGFKAIVVALQGMNNADEQCLAPTSQRKSGSRATRRWNWILLSFIALGVCLLYVLPAAAFGQGVQFSGVQSTVATGLNEPLGVAVDKAGNLFVANFGTPYLVKVPATGGTPVSVPLPTSDFITAVAVDGNDNLYVGQSDTTVGYVFKMPAGGGTATQVGSGWSYPSGIALDSSGDVFVADNGLNKVFELPAGGGKLTLNFSIVKYVGGIAVDVNGDVFVSDSGANQLAELRVGTNSAISRSVSGLALAVATDAAGNVFAGVKTAASTYAVVELPAGGGPMTTLGVTGLNFPSGVAVDSTNNLFIADYANDRIVEFETRAVNFASTNVCPAGQSTPAPCSKTIALNYTIPAGGDIAARSILTFGAPNLDFTVASGSTCTGHVDAGGTCTLNVTFTPKFPGLREGAVQIADDLGNVLANTNIFGAGVGPQIAFSSSKQTTVGSGFTQPFSYPSGVATDGAGDVYVADSYRVYKVPGGGGATTTVGTGLVSPTAVALDGAGNVYIVDSRELLRL